MFRCQRESCNKQCPPGQPQHSVITESREKTYQRKVYRGRRHIRTEEVIGSEIIKELKVCPECYEKLTGEEPRRMQMPAPRPRSKSSDQRWKSKSWKNKKKSKNKEPVIQRVNRHQDEKTK